MPKIKRYLTGYLMIAPVTLGLVWLYLIPFFRNLGYSFARVRDFGRGAVFIGLGNYRELIVDELFWRSLGNTALYTLVVVCVGVPIALIMAGLLRSVSRLAGFYRVVYFLPYITMPTVVALVFGLMFNQNFGVLNQLITAIGGEQIPWLSSPLWARVTTSAVLVWSSVGYNVVLLLAGMQTISPVYLEAARIDGAGPVKGFLSITLPLLSPVIFFVVVVQVIRVFQVFDVVFLLFNYNSPVYKYVSSAGTFYFRTAFVDNDRGLASAASIFIFIIIFLVTLVQFRLQKKWVSYGDN